MNHYEEKKIVIFASPVELRKLADKMEKRWQNLKPGNTTFIDFLVHKDELKVCLHLDQEYFHKLEGGNENDRF